MLKEYKYPFSDPMLEKIELTYLSQGICEYLLTSNVTVKLTPFLIESIINQVIIKK